MDWDEALGKYGGLVRQYAWSSYALSSIGLLRRPMEYIKRRFTVRRIVDLGSGYGILAALTRDYLEAHHVTCVDIDGRRLATARQLCDEVVEADFTQPLDLHGYDMATSHGALEHTCRWDPFLQNVKRALRDGGVLLLTTPNLASWTNRLLLLLGYQPRDVEISTQRLFGVPKAYGGPAGHVKAATAKALLQWLNHNGLHVAKVYPLYSPHPVNFIDRILAPFPTLARRIAVIAWKTSIAT